MWGEGEVGERRRLRQTETDKQIRRQGDRLFKRQTGQLTVTIHIEAVTKNEKKTLNRHIQKQNA